MTDSMERNQQRNVNRKERRRRTAFTQVCVDNEILSLFWQTFPFIRLSSNFLRPSFLCRNTSQWQREVLLRKHFLCRKPRSRLGIRIGGLNGRDRTTTVWIPITRHLDFICLLRDCLLKPHKLFGGRQRPGSLHSRHPLYSIPTSLYLPLLLLQVTLSWETFSFQPLVRTDTN